MNAVRWLLTMGLVLVVTIAQAADPCDGFRIGRYVAPPRAGAANSWWIEGPSGVVLVDTQLLPSATRELVEVAESYTGKKVVLAFVLQPTPDRYNGTAWLTEHGVRVVSSEQVVNAIPGVDRRTREDLGSRFRPDYPEKLVLPRVFGAETLTVAGAGLDFQLHVLGAAVAKAHLAVQLGPHLFVGDLLANRHHARLEAGALDEWLARLDELKRLGAQYLYPGRGYASGPVLIDRQAEYLKVVRNEIAARHPRGPMPANIEEDILSGIEQRYPDYENSDFLAPGVEALWRKYAK